MASALFDSLCALFDTEEVGGAVEHDPALIAELSARLESSDESAAFEDGSPCSHSATRSRPTPHGRRPI